MKITKEYIFVWVFIIITFSWMLIGIENTMVDIILEISWYISIFFIGRIFVEGARNVFFKKKEKKEGKEK